jgi:hypothetical protein
MIQVNGELVTTQRGKTLIELDSRKVMWSGRASRFLQVWAAS